MRQIILLSATALGFLWGHDAFATSAAPRLSDKDIVRQADTVVAGHFTGGSWTAIWEYDDQYDENGEPTTRQEVVTTRLFQITELIDGEEVPAGEIQLNLVGGKHGDLETPSHVAVPEPFERIVIGLIPDGGSPGGGYVLTHGKAFEAGSEDELKRLREWAREVRAAEPVHPDALLEEEWLRHEEQKHLDAHEHHDRRVEARAVSAPELPVEPERDVEAEPVATPIPAVAPIRESGEAESLTDLAVWYGLIAAVCLSGGGAAVVLCSLVNRRRARG